MKVSNTILSDDRHKSSTAITTNLTRQPRNRDPCWRHSCRRYQNGNGRPKAPVSLADANYLLHVISRLPVQSLIQADAFLLFRNAQPDDGIHDLVGHEGHHP